MEKLIFYVMTFYYQRKVYLFVGKKILSDWHPEYTKIKQGLNVRHGSLYPTEYKKIFPGNSVITGKNLLCFDVIWSDDLNLLPACLLGFPTNQYRDYRYRILPKLFSEQYQYCYEIN